MLDDNQAGPNHTSKDHDIARPFVVPCRTLEMSAPIRWLKLGWQDVRGAPKLTIVFGVMIVIVSAVVSWFAWQLGRFALLAALLSGFVYIAPLIGVGLYSVSRARLQHRVPQLSESFSMARRVAGHAGVFALIQLVIILVWSRSGMMLLAFLPVEQGDAQTLIEYLAMGSIIGSIFAALTFAVAAFSLPMIADRQVDVVTACLSSVNAVLRNKSVAAWWAFLIALLTLIGFATVFVGLGLIMPWLAYATFHAYRETLDASEWPETILHEGVF